MTLNNTNLFCYSSGSQKSKMNFMQLKLQCWQGWFFLEAMGGGGSITLSFGPPASVVT